MGFSRISKIRKVIKLILIEHLRQYKDADVCTKGHFCNKLLILHLLV